MANSSSYAYLWSSPNDDWVLLRINRRTLTLAVKFSVEGPTLREVATMRLVVPQFGVMPPTEAIAALKGRSEISLGTFEPKEGRALVEICKKHGLMLDVVDREESGYLPFNERTSTALIIEDDALAEQVCQEALRHGVRVKYVDA